MNCLIQCLVVSRYWINLYLGVPSMLLAEFGKNSDWQTWLLHLTIQEYYLLCGKLDFSRIFRRVKVKKYSLFGIVCLGEMPV